MTDRLEHLDVRRVLDSLGEGVSLAGPDGRIFFSNAAADRILGVPVSDDEPETWADHYGVFLPDGTTPFPPDQYPLVRGLRGEETDDVEMVVRNAHRPDGVRILVTGRPLRGDDDEVEGASVVFRDVTRLRQMEHRLATTVEALELAHKQKDEMFSFILHDFKGPVTTLVLLTELLHMGAIGLDDHESVEEIYRTARHLRRMSLDVLDAHLAEDGALLLEPEVVDLKPLLDGLRDDMAPGVRISGQTLEVHTSGQPTLVADPKLLERVVQNLIHNCMKFGPAGGRIVVEARVGPASARLEVRDDGQGVPEHLREAIFERYAMIERSEGRAPDSRGLGLRFCRVAAEAHGGRVWVEDNEPRGARFVVELPQGGAQA